MAAKAFYEFGPYRLELPTRRLLRDGAPVALTPKAFDTLQALIERCDRVVDKSELMKLLWPDAFVEEANLSQTIFVLRKVLGEAPGGRQYIDTIPRRGYRFAADVVEDGVATGIVGPATSSVAEARRPVLRARLTVAVVAAVVVVGAAALWTAREVRPPARVGGKVMLAVLPFENLTGDPEQEYFNDGLTEEMITQLGRLEPGRLGVIARTSAMAYKGTRKPADQIGRELRADYLLEGSVRRAGDRVRISAQLIELKDQTHVWADSYERDLRDVLGLQSEVAAAVARQVEVRLGPEQLARLEHQRPVNPEAYELYLKGRYYWNKRTADGYAKAARYHTQAIAADPGYAPAYAALADTYALADWRALFGNEAKNASHGEVMKKAKESALKALSLDPSLAEAHTALAFVLMHYDWNWAEADKQFRSALELNAAYPTAHHWYAFLLTATGQPASALTEIKRARELDPLSLIINTDVAEVLFYQHRYQEAIESARQALDMDPNFVLARRVLGWALMMQGNNAAAIEELKQAANTSGQRFDLVAALGSAYARAGDKTAARQIMMRLEELSPSLSGLPVNMALLHASLNEKDEAIASLRKASADRDGTLMLLNVHPLLDGLRSDPRFAELVRQVGVSTSSPR